MTEVRLASNEKRKQVYYKSWEGLSFGDYTVVENGDHKRRHFKSGGSILLHVKCKCGKDSWCTKTELQNGKRNRCDECGKVKRFGVRIGGISVNFFNNYKRGAKSRGVEFNITLQYVADLFQKQNNKCALSGQDLTIAGTTWDGRTASLDRIDSSKGYVEGNVQWIHKIINEMKMNQNQQEFIQWCKLIAKNN